MAKEMIKVHIAGDRIVIFTDERTNLETTWFKLKQLEHAITMIRHLNIEGNIDKLDLSFPYTPPDPPGIPKT